MATPIETQLEKDKEYYYCTCGKSEDKLFCDGSHQGTEFTPTAFSVDKDDTYYLCPCKSSNNKPFCDGSHQQ